MNSRPQSTARRVVKASLFALLALSSIAVTGCRHERPRRMNATAWEWRGELAAPAVLNIRNTAGAIEVEPSADNQVSVVASTAWTRGDPAKDVKFQAVSSGSSVTICAVWSRGECSQDNYSSNSKRGVHIGRARSDTRVSFKVRVPAGVRVDAWTMSGDVTIRAAAPVKAHTIDGDIKVGTAVGPVNAETINGDVDVRMTSLGDGGEIRAVTTNGDAVAYVPEISDGRISASTMNGDIGSDFGAFDVASQRVGRRLETVLGTGSRSYTVRSLNGSAWLRLINADGSVNRPAVGVPAEAERRATVTLGEKRP